MADEESILRKIQALVDKAYSTTFEAEQQALLAKADELMLKYSIDQMALQDPLRPNTAPNVKGSKPELRTFEFLKESVDYEIRSALSDLFRYCASYLFVRIGSWTYHDAKCVGYPADLDFLEMFYLRLKIHLIANLDPKPDPSKPWVDSMAALKNAGFKWEQIHDKLDGRHPDYPYSGQEWQRKFGVRFTAEMKRWSEQHGESRNKAGNLANWRRDFIDAYVWRLKRRMDEIRRNTLEENPNLPALLNDKKSEVDEAFWTEFPNERPHPKDCECDACHFLRCKDESCTRTVCASYRKQRNRPVRASAGYYRVRNTDAEARGRKVADTADLSTGGQLRG